MNRSEQINELAAALAKAQAEMSGASKDAANPFYKSKYADLKSIIEASRPALTKNGLAVIQAPRFHEGAVEVETMIAHSSGQWMSESLKVIVSKQDAQGIGSAIAYGRRYGYGSFVCLYTEDDDGNAAVGKSGNQRRATPSVAQAYPKPTDLDCPTSLEKIPESLDRDAPGNTRDPFADPVADYRVWLEDKPTAKQLNDEAADIAASKNVTEDEKKQLRHLFLAYAEANGMILDAKSKKFREVATV